MAKKKKQQQKSGARGWPILSDGLGCHPAQTKEFQEFCSKRGVPTDYTPDGQAVVTSQRHQDQLCKIFGVFNKDR